MNLGGIEKISLSDFPGRVATVFFCQGCNLHCPYCHNPSLINIHATDDIHWQGVIDYLRSRAGKIDGVVFSGGEPLLQSDLPERAADIKRLGLAVKIDTNGTLPQILKKLLQSGTVNYIAMDVKSSPERYHEAAGTKVIMEDVQESMRLIIESGLEYEFRTTIFRSLHDKKTMKGLARFISGADLLILQTPSGYPTLNPGMANQPEFSREEMELLRQAALPFVKDCRLRL